MAHAKGKSVQDFRRRKPSRVAAERILIVCEGAKSEPRYLRDLVADLGLTSADVIVYGEECGSDPVSVVNYAIEKMREDPDIDHIYCVFDKDEHPNFSAAMEKARSQLRRGTKSFNSVASVPCFEYWILLHYDNTARPYAREGSKSVCDCCVKDVREHIPNYCKGFPNLYRITRPHIERALVRAEARFNSAAASGEDNPTTEFYHLIRKLMSLKG